MLVDWDRFALWPSRPPYFSYVFPPSLPFSGWWESVLSGSVISISRPEDCLNPPLNKLLVDVDSLLPRRCTWNVSWLQDTLVDG